MEKVEKSTLVPMSYEGSDDEELEIVLGSYKNKNNKYDVVDNSKSKDQE